MNSSERSIELSRARVFQAALVSAATASHREGAEAVQNGRLQQEAVDGGKLVGQHFVHQVSGDVWILAGQG